MAILKLAATFSIFLTIACNNSRESERIERRTSTKTVQKKPEITTCNCFDGIGSVKGDTAIVEMKFSNGESVSVCGFVDKEMEGIILSEFNVFDCNTGKSLTEYDATQICRLNEKNDSLIIQVLKYLPTGKNWTWNLIQIGEQIITIRHGRLYVTEITPKLEKFHIDDKDVKIFLNSLRKGKGHNTEWELELGKLETLALMGNPKARNILENYEEFTGQETDGAVAETWKDAKATVQWIKK